MADLRLPSAILQPTLQALHSDNDDVVEDREDAMDVEADAGGAGAVAEDPTPRPMPRMLPPPDGRQFDSREAAESFLEVYCAQQGYAVSRRRCCRKGLRGFKAFFYCTFGYPNDRGHHQALRKTNQFGCPMGFVVDCLRRTNLRWTIDSSITKPHDHGPWIVPPRPIVPSPRRRKVAPVRQVVGGKLDGKRALITGADSGIGRAVALLFAREGADMSIVYLPHEQRDAERTQRLVEREGRECLLIPGNSMDNKACKTAVAVHVRKFRVISVLVNHASRQYFCDDIRNIDLDAVEFTFRSNILQMFAITKYAVRHMRAGGSIINTTSAQADQGISTSVDYSATEGAVVSFTRSLGKQLIAKGIRANAIALASVAASTQATSSLGLQVQGTSADSQIGASARFKEEARSFLFLAGMESSSFHGQILNAHPAED